MMKQYLVILMNRKMLLKSSLTNSSPLYNYIYRIFVNFDNCVRILATQILPCMQRCSENKKERLRNEQTG